MLVVPILTFNSAIVGGESESIIIQKEDLLYSLETLSENQILECEKIFGDYSSLEKNVFYQRYLYHEFVGNCVMLFEDRTWKYDDEDRTQKLIELSAKHISQREAKREHRETAMFVEIQSFSPLPIPITYLVAFEGCTGFDPIKADEVLIASDSDLVFLEGFVETDLVIPPGTCMDLEVEIRAQNSESIRFLIPGADVVLKGKPEALAEAIKITPNMQEDDTFDNTANSQFELAYVVEPLTVSEIQACERAYNDFITLDQDDFTSRYLYHRFMGNCVMLFEDPVWIKQTAFRYQELSERSVELAQAKGLMNKENQLDKPSVKTIFIHEIEDSLFLYSFEGCTGNSPFKLHDILAASDIEVLSLLPQGRVGEIFPPRFCTSMEAKINAADSESIRIVIQGMIMDQKESNMTPRDQMMKGISPYDVTCKEGLELIIKKTDDSPACVRPKAFEKLVERGWGIPAK